MRKIALTCFLISFSLITIAQNKNKIIVQKNFADNSLFFIYPQKFTTNLLKFEFEADFTINYLKETDHPDKVQMNFTIYSKDPVQEIKDIRLKLNGDIYLISDKFERFFIEKKNNKIWSSRFGTSIKYKDLLNIINPEKEVRLIVTSPEVKFEVEPRKKIKDEYSIAYQTLTFHL